MRSDFTARLTSLSQVVGGLDRSWPEASWTAPKLSEKAMAPKIPVRIFLNLDMARAHFSKHVLCRSTQSSRAFEKQRVPANLLSAAALDLGLLPRFLDANPPSLLSN